MGEAEKSLSVSRRTILTGLIASVVSGTIGAALGYKYAATPRAHKLARLLHLPGLPVGFKEFGEQARNISERQRQQTVATVAKLKAKYENAVFGKVRIWDLVEKLAHCVDPTDTRLYCMSQFVHVQQVIAAMEQNRIEDPDLLIAAVIHDLGKVLLLIDELPENVVCPVRRLGEYPGGVGLDHVVYQFGHAEWIYSRIKDHVPDHIAWVVRYHNINLRDAARYMDARDRAYTEKYLLLFRRFDRGFKSLYFHPNVNLAKYRDLVEEYFPRPLLF